MTIGLCTHIVFAFAALNVATFVASDSVFGAPLIPVDEVCSSIPGRPLPMPAGVSCSLGGIRGNSDPIKYGECGHGSWMVHDCIRCREDMKYLKRRLSLKDQQSEEMRMSLLKEIRELDGELEGERRGKSGAVSQRKKMEFQLTELEQQLEEANRLKDECNKELKKNQQMIQEYQHAAEEAREMKEDIAGQMRDVERRLRSAEAEYQLMAELNEQLSAAKRALEAEKEELEESRGEGCEFSAEEKRRLEDEIDEEKCNLEISLDKQRQAQLQVEQLTTELSMERSLAQKMDAEKQALESQIRELKNKMLGVLVLLFALLALFATEYGILGMIMG